MSIGAIIMMCIACIGLWGGALLSLGIMFKKSGKTVGRVAEDIEYADVDNPSNARD